MTEAAAPAAAMAPAVSLTGVGKRYTKYEDAPLLVTAALRLRTRTRRTPLWAVRGVDLEVAPGECLGVIGRNGSGKSTLLSMLAGVTAPTEGRVTVRGRVAPLISVGVGFHPELTGRENVFVNGMILGLSRRQVEERLEAIVDFADIPGFLDTPVKFYSSGMFVRLGFSVAVHSDPDVLLVDEVLAVGDLGFQVKCFDRMTEIRERGATIVVVSHNLNAVRHLCSRTAVLHRGSVRFCGTTPDAISVFHDLMAGEGDVPAEDGELPRRAGVAEVSGVDLVGPDGRSTRHLAANSTATFRLGVRLHAPLERAFFGMGVTNEAGANVYSEASWSLDTGPLVAGSDVVCEVPVQLPLATGTYTAHLSVYDSDMAQVAVAPTLAFYVSNRETVDGVADLAAGFRLCPTD